MSEEKTAETSPFPEAREIVRISRDPALLEVTVYYRGKTGGYYVERTSIRSILDRSGRSVEPLWDEEWAEVAPGIETRGENRSSRTTFGDRSHQSHIRGSLRIYRSACPVYVRFLKTWEYNDYDDYSFSTQENEAYWVRFEADDH
jgi:hypothetical protein